jgi:hypothetical protein
MNTHLQTVDRASIEQFMHGQVACWNAHDRSGFLDWYKKMATLSLEIEYVGRTDQKDGWFVIEEMWDKHNTQFELVVATTAINGNEAAVHHHNNIRGTDVTIESIETYRFEPGRLWVRYFLKAPASDSVDTEQFRGLAQAPVA